MFDSDGWLPCLSVLSQDPLVPETLLTPQPRGGLRAGPEEPPRDFVPVSAQEMQTLS